MAGRWANTHPAEVERWLEGAPAEWWFAGGWAIDLWLGRQTREHSDLEIGCFRLDLPAFAAAFAGWEVAIARQKQLLPYDLESAPPEPPFSLWLRKPPSAPWSLEILVEEREGAFWCYRRDARVWRAIDQLTIRADGHRVVAPEIQLLYKAMHLRDKDRADFDVAVPRLSEDARAWLRGALAVAHPGHEWIAAL